MHALNNRLSSRLVFFVGLSELVIEPFMQNLINRKEEEKKNQSFYRGFENAQLYRSNGFSDVYLKE